MTDALVQFFVRLDRDSRWYRVAVRASQPTIAISANDAEHGRWVSSCHGYLHPDDGCGGRREKNMGDNVVKDK